MRSICPGILVLVLAATTARADDRAMTMVVGFSGVAQLDNELDGDAASGPLLTLGWEDPPLAYPDKRGVRYGGSLVPELIGGVMLGSQRAEGLLGAGLRAELKMAQREGGLMRLTCRASAYVAARGMVIGEDRDPMVEGVIGEYFQLQSGIRFGFDVGAVARRGQTMELGNRAGVTGQFYVGWGPGGPPLR